MPDREPKVYDVDAALDRQRPWIRLRGEDYRLADRTVAERIEMVSEIQAMEEEIDTRREEGEDIDPDEFQEVIYRGVQTFLEGVPDEVANDVTEAEWKLIRRAYFDYRGIQLDFSDDEKNGTPATS